MCTRVHVCVSYVICDITGQPPSFFLKLMRVHLHFSQELHPPFLFCPYFLSPALTLLNPPLFTLKFTHLFWHSHTPPPPPSSSVFMKPPSLPVLLFSPWRQPSQGERKGEKAKEEWNREIEEGGSEGEIKKQRHESVFSCVCNWPIKNWVLGGKQFSGWGLAPAGSSETRLWICKWVCKRH